MFHFYSTFLRENPAFTVETPENRHFSSTINPLKPSEILDKPSKVDDAAPSELCAGGPMARSSLPPQAALAVAWGRPRTALTLGFPSKMWLPESESVFVDSHFPRASPFFTFRSTFSTVKSSWDVGLGYWANGFDWVLAVHNSGIEPPYGLLVVCVVSSKEILTERVQLRWRLCLDVRIYCRQKGRPQRR